MVRAHFTIRFVDACLPASGAQWVADADAARVAARTIVQGLMRQYGGDPRLLGAAILISDDDGVTLFEMSFFDALYMPVEPIADPDRRRPRAPRKPTQTRLRAAMGPVRRLAGALGAKMQPRLEP